MRAPRKTKAFAVETNVKEGTMTSSPAGVKQQGAHLRACVQELVTIALGTPSVCSNRAWHLFE